MVRILSFVLLAGAILNALIDKFNAQNIIILVLCGLLVLFSLLYDKLFAAEKSRNKKTAIGIAFFVVILGIVAASALFPPDNMYTLTKSVNKAASLISSGDYKQAEKLLLKLYDKHESDPVVNLNLGVVYLKKRNTDLARQHFDKASNGLQFDENYWFNYGLLYYQNKEYQRAKSCFERASQLNPGFLKANIYAGTMSYTIGDMKNAIYYLKYAEFLKPDSAEILLHLGRAFTGIMEYDNAIDCFERALALRPSKELKKALEEQINEVVSAKGGVRS